MLFALANFTLNFVAIVALHWALIKSVKSDTGDMRCFKMVGFSWLSLCTTVQIRLVHSNVRTFGAYLVQKGFLTQVAK